MVRYDWVNFYKEFAHELLAQRDNRHELVEHVESTCQETGINLPILEKDNQIVDIDPLLFLAFLIKTP